MADLNATLIEIHDYGSELASLSRRISACNFLNKVIFAQPDAPLLAWNGAGVATEVSGLVPGERFFGVSAFHDLLVIWFGDRLKWSDSNDFTSWIPVAKTASSFVFTLTSPYTKGALGEESDFLAVDKSPTGLVAGQFLRIDTDPTYSFFEVVRVLPTVGQDGAVAGFLQVFPVDVAMQLFLRAFVPYLKGTRLYFGGAETLEVQADAVSPGGETMTLAADFTNPSEDYTVEVSVTSRPGIPTGGFVSVGSTLNPGQDIFSVQAVDLNAQTITLRRMGVGLTSSPVAHYAGEFIVAQPFVSVKNIGTSSVSATFLNEVSERYGFTVKPLDLTGSAAVGTVYPEGAKMLTLDANEAGEQTNTGSGVTGEILQFVTLSDYGYILKHRSFQSVQYVGVDQGILFMRAEITDEGLIGRYSFVKVGKDELYFWGNKEIYRYSGGNQLVPIGQQFTRQLFAELDRSRVDEIVGFHKEGGNEIWFIYPTKSSLGISTLRVFVYNYLENSCTLDDYPAVLGALTAAGRVEWASVLTWDQAEGTWEAPIPFIAGATWDDGGASASETFDIIASSEGDLGVPLGLVHDAGAYDRLGAAYVSYWESADMDAGDPAVWKYADTLLFNLQMKGVPPVGAAISVYLGTKLNTDEALVWHGPKILQADALGTGVTKVNIPAAGKFLRVRVESNLAGIQWRVSQFRVMGRQGGTV